MAESPNSISTNKIAESQLVEIRRSWKVSTASANRDASVGGSEEKKSDSSNEESEDDNNGKNGGRRPHSNSFAGVDGAQASVLLEALLKTHSVKMGGSSIGKGFKKAALEHLNDSQQIWDQQVTEMIRCNVDLNLSQPPLEEAFYVVDIGIVISQVHQWRRYFPRVEAFYAVKCNPDPLIVKTLAILGCHFDCASISEIELVQNSCQDLSRQPEIIYANPCKAQWHIVQAIMRGVTLMTFDNVAEVKKCASISKKIQLVLRIVTDDRGAQCRLSSKFGAPKARWHNLLQAAKDSGLNVVGVSFHVGSGSRDGAARYEAALKDARELFDIAKKQYGFHFTILDIGGGFPGETHSFWNPAVLDLPVEPDDDDDDEEEGLDLSAKMEAPDSEYLFFMEIASAVAPLIDEIFPESDVRVIGEPGRYFVAAAATLVAAIVGARSNEVDGKPFNPEAISDAKTSESVHNMSRDDEKKIVHKRGASFDKRSLVLENISEELTDYARLYAKQNLVTQETDVYNDGLDLYKEDYDTAADLLGVPDEEQMKSAIHTVEGMPKGIALGDGENSVFSLAAAGEAAVSGMVMQAVADSTPLQDDYAYYVNDGVYGGFNNLMFDHATVRPRVLQTKKQPQKTTDQSLYASTVFGPTCDSIDVIARSVLLPKLNIGDFLYFQNMGAYTMAAASSFNGFSPTQNVYVCSVQLEFLENLIAGPTDDAAE